MRVGEVVKMCWDTEAENLDDYQADDWDDRICDYNSIMDFLSWSLCPFWSFLAIKQFRYITLGNQA